MQTFFAATRQDAQVQILRRHRGDVFWLQVHRWNSRIKDGTDNAGGYVGYSKVFGKLFRRNLDHVDTFVQRSFILYFPVG